MTLAIRGYFVYFDERTGKMLTARRTYLTTRLDVSRYLNKNSKRNNIHKRGRRG